MLKLPPLLEADRDAGETKGNIHRQFVVHADFIKIGMIKPPADRLDLEFLDQGELFQALFSFDEQFDEDVFFLGLYDLQKVGHVHRQRDSLLAAAVKNGGNQSFLSETSCRSLAGFFAGTGF